MVELAREAPAAVVALAKIRALPKSVAEECGADIVAAVVRAHPEQWMMVHVFREDR